MANDMEGPDIKLYLGPHNFGLVRELPFEPVHDILGILTIDVVAEIDSRYSRCTLQSA